MESLNSKFNISVTGVYGKQTLKVNSLIASTKGLSKETGLKKEIKEKSKRIGIKY